MVSGVREVTLFRILHYAHYSDLRSSHSCLKEEFDFMQLTELECDQDTSYMGEMGTEFSQST